MAQKFSGLGRGLGSLIPQKKAPTQTATATVEPAVLASEETAAPRQFVTEPEPRQVVDTQQVSTLFVAVAEIEANPDQPRTVFRHQPLEDLMNSIKEHGVLQPLAVTRRPEGGYELIAGERRLRAARMLGLEKVPVMIREAKLDEKLVLGLIENIQREDLNPLEEARAYERLIQEFGFTQEMVAKKVGKARPTIANALRLLELPQEIQDAIAAGTVSAGSARAIVSIQDTRSRLALFRKLVGEKMNTRQVEAGVRSLKGKAKDPAVAAAEEQLREQLGAKVEIKKRGGKGAVAICFYSDEEFEAVMVKLIG